MRREPAIARREAEEQVAARVLATSARARETDGRALREALALTGQERRVGREDHDDRARTLGRTIPATGRGRGRARARPAPRRPAGARVVRGWPARARPPRSRRRHVPSRRDAVPMPPLKPWQTMPVPPPIAPSATLPARASTSASRRWSPVTCWPSTSFSRPSHVSPTTGSDQAAPAAALPPLDRAQRVAHDSRRCACS